MLDYFISVFVQLRKIDTSIEYLLDILDYHKLIQIFYDLQLNISNLNNNIHCF